MKSCVEVLGEPAQEGEYGVPDDGDLQYAHAAKAVRQGAGEPAAEGGDQQRDGAEDPGLAGADVPEREQARDHEGKDLHIERIQRPAAEACGHGALFARGQVGEPGEHDGSSLWYRVGTCVAVRDRSNHSLSRAGGDRHRDRQADMGPPVPRSRHWLPSHARRGARSCPADFVCGRSVSQMRSMKDRRLAGTFRRPG